MEAYAVIRDPDPHSPAALAASIAAVMALLGCASLPDDCPDRLRCSRAPEARLPGEERPLMGGAGGAGGAAEHRPLDAGGAAMEALSCDPSEDGSSVPEACGVFVRASGNDASPGSPRAPVATIARAVALAAAGSRRVYACAETFAEAIDLREPVVLYGGLACDEGWVYAGGSPTTLAPPRGVPLTLRRAARGAMLRDFSIVAPSGALPGESSIAAIADGAVATLSRCSLIAGRGADGALGGALPEIPVRDGEAGKCAASGGRGRDGAGGCGGQGGLGGTAGGSSIALDSIDAELTLSQVALYASDGGRGGQGGDPQRGGRGGAGGHSIGLAYTGACPLVDDRAISLGVAGSGGLSAGAAGANGIAAKKRGFP